VVDVLTPEQRKLNMSRVRGKDTRIEIMLRLGLHAKGLRFRLHRRDLPGKPDMVFSKSKAVIFVHGCFWHGHCCPRFKLPKTRQEFWGHKVAANQQRDRTAMEALVRDGWRVLVVWECALMGRARWDFSEVIDACVCFIRSKDVRHELIGRWERLEHNCRK